MTSSTSSSARRATPRLLLAVALLAAGCRHPGLPPPPAGVRIALFPMANLAGTAAPVREIQGALEGSLRARGLDLVPRDRLEQFLARHRVRWTSGIDSDVGRAAKEELGVDYVLVSSLDLYASIGVPRLAMAMRLVTASEDPEIRWIDADARAGDDHPGLFGLGLVSSVKVLEERAIAALTGSLVASLGGRPLPAGGCAPASGPRILFRSRQPLRVERPRVAILPFRDETPRSDAGEIVSFQLLRWLVRAPGIRVVEPGVVRGTLLRSRIVMEGGVNHEAARVAFGALGADAVISGTVHIFEELPVPRVELSALALATWDNRVVWNSTSHGRGDDGVFFFDAGRVTTTDALACSLVRGLAAELAATMTGRRVR